jgi:hypothetical protein
MRWIEPNAIAKEGAKLCNPPFIRVAGVLLSAAGFALFFTISCRLRFGIWHWSGLVIGGAIGFLAGLLRDFTGRFPVIAQEIELRPDEFWIRGNLEVTFGYRDLRGYSIMDPAPCACGGRLLVLYPQAGGTFSIGIDPAISDSDIHLVLSPHVVFQTFIDDLALKVS